MGLKTTLLIVVFALFTVNAQAQKVPNYANPNAHSALDELGGVPVPGISQDDINKFLQGSLDNCNKLVKDIPTATQKMKDLHKACSKVKITDDLDADQPVVLGISKQALDAANFLANDASAWSSPEASAAYVATFPPLTPAQTALLNHLQQCESQPTGEAYSAYQKEEKKANECVLKMNIKVIDKQAAVNPQTKDLQERSQCLADLNVKSSYMDLQVEALNFCRFGAGVDKKTAKILMSQLKAKKKELLGKTSEGEAFEYQFSHPFQPGWVAPWEKLTVCQANLKWVSDRTKKIQKTLKECGKTTDDKGANINQQTVKIGTSAPAPATNDGSVPVPVDTSAGKANAAPATK